MSVIKKNKLIRISRQMAFFWLLVSLAGFLSQGAVHYLITPWLGFPVHILCIFFSVLCLLAGGDNRKIPVIVIVNLGIIGLIVFFVEYQKGVSLLHMKRLWQIFVGTIIFWVSFNLVNDKKWLLRLFYAIFALVFLNSVVGIGEYISGNSVPWSVYKNTTYNIPVALEYFPVALGYALAAPVAILVVSAAAKSCVWFCSKQIIYFFLAVLGVLVLFLSGSRSCLLGVLVGSSVGVIFFCEKYKSLVIVVLIFSISFFSYLLMKDFTGCFNNSGNINNVDNAVRVKQNDNIKKVKSEILLDPRLIDNYITFLPVIFGGNYFSAKSFKDSQDVLAVHREMGLHTKIETIDNALSIRSPHNFLLTVGVLYGPIAFLSALFFYFLILREGVACYLYVCEEDRYVAGAIVAGIIAFVVQSSFHNAGLYLGEMRNWLYLGLLFGMGHRTIKK